VSPAIPATLPLRPWANQACTRTPAALRGPVRTAYPCWNFIGKSAQASEAPSSTATICPVIKSRLLRAKQSDRVTNVRGRRQTTHWHPAVLGPIAQHFQHCCGQRREHAILGRSGAYRVDGDTASSKFPGDISQQGFHSRLRWSHSCPGSPASSPSTWRKVTATMRPPFSTMVAAAHVPTEAVRWLGYPLRYASALE